MVRTAAVCGLLTLAILSVYSQVAGHDFVEFDDALYITENRVVQQGLGLETIGWAFVSTDAYIWHPVTWLSYLLDSQLYGVDSAAPWLLTNVAWHAAGAMLLLAALTSLTGRFWPSALAAGFFALHPIQVESVAWASGRKEVLAGFFLILTLWAYSQYVKQRSRGRFAAVVGSMMLCFGAKGSHVGLPFLLLLLDYWPLSRLRRKGEAGPAAGKESIESLLLEKYPLLILSFVVIYLNVITSSAVSSPWVSDPPLPDRLLDGVMAYAATLRRIIWPDVLAIVYPTPVQMGLPRVDLLLVAGAFGLLTVVTALAAAAGRRRGYLLVGWLWFIGMLLPVVGLVPNGLRVMHDRYAYVPLIGLAIAVSFGASDLLARLRVPRAASAAMASFVLLVCALVSWNQVGVWRDSLTLFDHALAVTRRNAIVHFYKGNTHATAGDFDAAEREFRAALEIYPPYPAANNNLGRVYRERGDLELAIHHFHRASEGRPTWTEALTNLADAQRESGRFEAAAAGYREVLRLDPGHEPAARGLEQLRRGTR